MLGIQDKIVTNEQMRALIRAWQDNGLEVVFTNGCFDILHLGHIEYLEQARSFGDKLVVALNSDDSVRKLKGASRPINDVHSRSYLMASLTFVDLVTVFEEDTPFELIQMVLPDILTKGGDYKEADVVGADIVKAHGGRVEILPFKKGYSTTSIEEKILALRKTGQK